jgi:hypothetical protein
MIRNHDIKWFLEEPERLMEMKPFTRGGVMLPHGYDEMEIRNNTTMNTGFTSLSLHPISQDTYITEYRPDMHHIILNKAIPHIKLVFDGTEFPSNMMELTQTASFQKLIHSAHVRNLTTNPLDFTLCNENADETETNAFSKIKQEWLWRDREWNKYQAINTCKQLGNCATLFIWDKDRGKYDVLNYSYEDGYQIVPNKDEYGFEIARSLFYEVGSEIVIDTYDNEYHYRCIKKSNGWERQDPQRHGFSRNPLLHKRGKVAWEYAESSIEMWELMANIQAIALKRFGTFALVLIGDMDSDSFKRDSSTLIINLSSDNTNGKQDAKTLTFPEPQTMDGYLKTLEEKISLFSSTTFITPKDITTSNSGGNGIALAMSNDYALATQSALDWQRFVNEMVYLHQEGLDLETNGIYKFSKIKIGAKIIPWSLETNNTKITNLAMEAPYLSTQTIVERCPDAAPDEIKRIIKERGTLVGRNDQGIEDNAAKAHNIAVNRNDDIIDNIQPVIDIEPTSVNA